MASISDDSVTVDSIGAPMLTAEMQGDQLEKNYEVIYRLTGAMGDANLKGDLLAYPLIAVLKTGAWRRFRARNNRVYEHSYFGDFLTAKVPAGLETTLERVRFLVRGNGEAEKELEEALMREGGAPLGNQNAAADKTTLNNVQGCSSAPTGNSRAATIRRITKLARDTSDPLSGKAAELLDQIYDGKLSANQAAIQLGIRKQPAGFDLNSLSPEVRAEIDRRKAEEEWTTAELLEEALRAYFRLLSSDEPSEPEAPQGGTEPPLLYTSAEGMTAPSGIYKQADAARILGMAANNLTKRLTDAGREHGAELIFPRRKPPYRVFIHIDPAARGPMLRLEAI